MKERNTYALITTRGTLKLEFKNYIKNIIRIIEFIYLHFVSTCIQQIVIFLYIPLKSSSESLSKSFSVASCIVVHYTFILLALIFFNLLRW